MQTNTLPKVSAPPKHYFVRTFFASVFGFIGLSLVIVSILVVWANRTVTDTNTYVKTVGPLASKPEIQDFIATKISDQIVKAGSSEDMAGTLLSVQERTGKTPEQLSELVRSTVNSAVRQVLGSQSFNRVWEQTNRDAHAQLLRQIKSDEPVLTLDLSPIVNTVIGELKTTRLAAVSDKIQLEPGVGVVGLEGSGIQKAHTYYDNLQKATIGLVVLCVVCLALAVGLSVNHGKTLRRIGLAIAVSCGLLTIALHAPSFISPSSTDSAEQGVALVVARSLFADIGLATLVISLACFAAVIGSKLYQRKQKHSVVS